MVEEYFTLLLTQLQAVSPFVWAATGLLLTTLWLSRRDHAKIKKLQKELKQARNDLKALTTSSLGVGSRIIELERQIRAIKLQPQQPVQQTTPVTMLEHSNQPYDHAAHLVQQGKDSDEIAKMCGISRNEAELIAMMQRLEKAS